MAIDGRRESKGETESWLQSDPDFSSLYRGKGFPENTAATDSPVAGESSKATEPGWKMRGNPVSDLSTKHDKLGFVPYVDAVAAFLKHEHTRPPLTMSIEGEWGTGKSSFMLQLKAELDKPPSHAGLYSPYERPVGRWNAIYRRWRVGLQRKSKNTRLTFWFNAWRHDKQDAMWATFALSITKEIRKEQSLTNRMWGDVKLAASRIGTLGGWIHTVSVLLLWLLVALGAAGIVVYTFDLNSPEREQIAGRVLSFFGKPVPSPPVGQNSFALLVEKMSAAHYGFAVLFFVVSYGFWIHKHVGQNLELNLKKYLDQPDYKNRTSFIESFHYDFKKVVNAYAGKRKVFIFIDDLDRCDIPRAADLMQAINLMIGDDDHLVFIIGMDREKVAAGITFKYKDLAPFLKSSAVEESVSARHPSAFGYTFLEKFIQITFRVPRPSESGIEEFLMSMGQSDEEIRGEERQRQTEQAARRERRRRVEVSSRADSSEVQRQVKLVAPALGWNPRRFKQFINDFRLQAYIASGLGLLDLVAEEDGPETAKITLEQLGKFVAITIAWPDLVMDLIESPDLLARIYIVYGMVKRDPAATDMPASDVTSEWDGAAPEDVKSSGNNTTPTPRQIWLVQRWSEDIRLKELLLANTTGEDGARYSLAKTDLRVFLDIAPRVNRGAYAGSASSSADAPYGTSSSETAQDPTPSSGPSGFGGGQKSTASSAQAQWTKSSQPNSRTTPRSDATAV